MADRQNDFSRGSIPRNIMDLAIPMTAAQLVNVLYSVVDRIYLGHLPASTAHQSAGSRSEVKRGAIVGAITGLGRIMQSKAQEAPPPNPLL